MLPGGTASNYLIHYSYGKSPYTDSSIVAYFVLQSGVVYDIRNGIYSVNDSYGRRSPITNDEGYAWDVRSDGLISSLYNVYYSSYGNCFFRSPDTNYGNFAGLVGQSGDVYNYGGSGVGYSYGIWYK